MLNGSRALYNFTYGKLSNNLARLLGPDRLKPDPLLEEIRYISCRQRSARGAKKFAHEIGGQEYENILALYIRLCHFL
jgi:hypothetical protein